MSDLDDPGVRLFFAAWPDAITVERFSAAVDAVPLEAAARRVSPANFHLTFAFVGEVAVSRVAALQQIGAGLRAAAFCIRFDAYEYWPKPEVVVAAARQIPPALDGLWQQLHRDLAAQQWALNPKRLRPHVTIARKVLQAPVLQAMSAFEWNVRAFSLVSSGSGAKVGSERAALVSSGSGATQSVYTVLDTWPLLYEP